MKPSEMVRNTQGSSSASSKYDIVIIGAGPAGLLLSTCLARWGYKIRHIDNRPEPTKTGRADGIQPRSLDLLRNMGLKPDIMAHGPARVYEVAFWDPTSSGDGIHRTGTWASCPNFIDARYPFTTLLHQGLIERVFLKDLKKNGVNVQRPWTIKGFKTDPQSDADYPVEVDLQHVDGIEKETVRAKYLFSGEGARSTVRDQLKIGIKHKDPIAHVWGVMDGVVQTDFPDIRVSSKRFIADEQMLTDFLTDEMYYPFRAWLSNGYPEGKQYGSPVHSNRLFHRQRLASPENSIRRRSPKLSKENLPSL
jgi:2-polyprenyl-6-methoxyphenol hydroxylase-like FAD-dependent oxidoreductase